MAKAINKVYAHAMKQEFVARYAVRKDRTSPQSIMKNLGCDPDMLVDWLQDHDFIDELRRLDHIRSFSIIEEIHRAMPKIVESMIQVAQDPAKKNGIKAAETLMKLAGVLTETHGRISSSTNIAIVDQRGNHELSVEELQEKHGALLKAVRGFKSALPEGTSGENEKGSSSG